MPGGNAVSAVWLRKPDRDRRRSRTGGGSREGVAQSADARGRCAGARADRHRHRLCGRLALDRAGDAGRDRPLCRMADDRGRARDRAWCAAASWRLLVAGIWLALGRIETALVVLGVGAARRGVASRRSAASGLRRGFAMPPRRRSPRCWCGSIRWGFAALMFVLLMVWVTDIGGYFAGRGIGGPKLWPRVSPKKTWAGAIGGFAASLVVAAGFAASVSARPARCCCWRRCCRLRRNSAISSNPR